MTGETRWVTVRTPQIGDDAWHKTRELDPRPVVAIRRSGRDRRGSLEIQLDIVGMATSWIPASNYTFKRAELVPDTEPTDAEVVAFRAAYNSGTMLFSRDNRDDLIRAGLRAVLALRAGEPS